MSIGGFKMVCINHHIYPPSDSQQVAVFWEGQHLRFNGAHIYLDPLYVVSSTQFVLDGC